MKIKRFVIEIYNIIDDHIFATPKHTKTLYVEGSMSEVDNYITKELKDDWGHKFKRKAKFGFDYISSTGAIKLHNYKEPIFKKL